MPEKQIYTEVYGYQESTVPFVNYENHVSGTYRFTEKRGRREKR
jgi:hypothetical protein